MLTPPFARKPGVDDAGKAASEWPVVVLVAVSEEPMSRPDGTRWWFPIYESYLGLPTGAQMRGTRRLQDLISDRYHDGSAWMRLPDTS